MEAKEKKPENGLVERRKYPRFAASGKLPAVLRKSDDELSFFLVDVSEKGLGVVLDEEINAGTELILEFNDSKDTIVLILTWTFKSGSWPDIYRCGLKVKDTKLDLVKIVNGFEGVFLEDMS